MTDILQKGSPVLRKTAEAVPLSDIHNAEIQKIITDMKTALRPYKEGVALAAPQIGHSSRIFVVSGHVFNPEALQEDNKEKANSPDLVFINPEIVKTSRKKEWMSEGCLSVKDTFGEIKRAEKTTVRAYDEQGSIFTRGASGLFAQIIQHEVDHLNGVLFIDNAKELRNIPPRDTEINTA